MLPQCVAQRKWRKACQMVVRTLEEEQTKQQFDSCVGARIAYDIYVHTYTACVKTITRLL